MELFLLNLILQKFPYLRPNLIHLFLAHALRFSDAQAAKDVDAAPFGRLARHARHNVEMHMRMVRVFGKLDDVSFGATAHGM